MAENQTIAVEKDLGYRDFIRNYLSKGRPVVLKGALKGMPAAQ
jgi:hypothetical protein